MSELGFTSPREMAAALFIIGGLIFFIGSGIGMLRLPDFTAASMHRATARRWAAC